MPASCQQRAGTDDGAAHRDGLDRDGLDRGEDLLEAGSRRARDAYDRVARAGTLRCEETPMVADGFTTCLWFDGQAEEAARYYMSIFKDSKLGRVGRHTEAGPGPAGSVLVVEFEINGQKFIALNGGPQFTFNEAISFQIHCDDQDEVDYYWSRLSEDGEEVACGWLKDKYGVSWQVVPAVLIDMIADPDQEKARRTTEAMMAMTKFDIAALRRAYAGE
jgi:predicted 3-demethylubiquinone-9 3-methyltransferase (glyoxalase superfamily)